MKNLEDDEIVKLDNEYFKVKITDIDRFNGKSYKKVYLKKLTYEDAKVLLEKIQ